MPDVLIESERFPYLPVTVDVLGQPRQVEALVDTGFSGYLVLPEGFLPTGRQPDFYTILQVADTRQVSAAVYTCTISIGSVPPFDALVTVLGNEPILGLEVVRRFTLILDHGIRVRLEA